MTSERNGEGTDSNVFRSPLVRHNEKEWEMGRGLLE